MSKYFNLGKKINIDNAIKYTLNGLRSSSQKKGMGGIFHCAHGANILFLI